MKILWPAAVVEEGNLAHNISHLRHALGEHVTGQQFVETVSKHGYRFVAEVRESTDEPRTPSHAGVSPHEIRICTTPDKVRIAYATIGKGPPLVKTANRLNHLEFDWHSPVWRHLVDAFARDHQFVRYDERGHGLSDWEVGDISFDAFVSDLEAVVDAAGLERFALLGISQGCAVSVAYATRHPERVTALVLHGGYLRGWKNQPDAAVRGEALQTLIGLDWGRDNPAIRQMFTSSFVPDGTAEQIAWFNELQRVSTSPANAVRLRAAFGAINVAELASRVSVPTLVLHSTGNRVIQFSAGRELAAAIPGARFVPIESRNHLIREHEPIWPQYVETIRRFLDPRLHFYRLSRTGVRVDGSRTHGLRHREKILCAAPTRVMRFPTRLGSTVGTARPAPTSRNPIGVATAISTLTVPTMSATLETWPTASRRIRTPRLGVHGCTPTCDPRLSRGNAILAL